MLTQQEIKDIILGLETAEENVQKKQIQQIDENQEEQKEERVVQTVN